MTHKEMYRLVIEAGMETARREWWKGFVVGSASAMAGLVIGIVIYGVWFA